MILNNQNFRQTILLTSRWQGKDNIITLNWHTPLSLKPPMYGVVIGKNRYSLSLIKNSKVFVVNFMPENFKKEVLYCGKNSGKVVDKFKETGLKKEEAETIDCSCIKQATGFLECRVEKEVEIGDSVLFLAKITKTNLKQTCPVCLF